MPTRIAFKVSSKIDSRIILDAIGAEQLNGKGDALISHNGELIKLQCAFVNTQEIEKSQASLVTNVATHRHSCYRAVRVKMNSKVGIST